jgi:hypothetical protein
VYVATVILASITGLQMVWSRPEPIRIVQNAGVSIDALLIVLFAILAVRHVMKRNLGAHRRWALRLFMVVNAGWFFRVGMLQSLLLEHRPAEPFLNFVAYADYLLPLALLELYLRAKERGSVTDRFALAAVVCALTVVMVAGIAVATKTVWLPRIVAEGAAR